MSTEMPFPNVLATTVAWFGNSTKSLNPAEAPA